MPTKLDAVFYSSAMSREPVRKWLLSLTRDERRIIGTDIAYVQWKWPLGKPRVEHLHGFIKKSQRTPADEIALALARWKEWKDAEGQ